MFGMFKKKSEIEPPEARYVQFSKEAFTLSVSNRRLSDGRTAGANEVLKQIEH
ncbi:MAG: Lacal_2735 family protein [Cyclobacteriaceae bacterium]|nr:Lacal_2735 family protein [Cyclobacteriaceae bacterium]